MLATSSRFTSRSILIASRIHHTPVVARQIRFFSQSPPWHASENQDSFMTNYQNTTLFRQLADKPEALKALNDFAKMLQEQGIDITGNSQPTNTQMFRLAASARFRESAKRVMTELRSAGLDFSSKEAMEELMKLSKGGRPGQA